MTASVVTLPRMIRLRFCEVLVHPGEYRNPKTGDVEHRYGYVETRFDDGLKSPAARVPNDTTRQDAADLGYSSDDRGVWQSLVEHELFHSVLSHVLWDRMSAVLRHEAGAMRVPYFQRVHEESIVLGWQLYFRTGYAPQSVQDFVIDGRAIWMLRHCGKASRKAFQ